jgi:MoaA/NifB/PqqE/SkfB family radical SAM enzyme
VHCLSSSGRRDPRELSTAECTAVIDELQRMQVFYVNIGGGEPTVRPDFWELLDYAVAHDVGVKFSTNGIKLDKARAAQLAATDYVDVQISLDGATASVNDAVRGPGSYATALRALENLAEAGFARPKISVVMTRQNVDQLDEFAAIADKFGAQLRITRLRPSGRGADVWDELHPTAAQQRQLYDWLVERGDGVLTGDSFFDSCQGGCMAAKFFTGLPLDGPDPECVRGFGEQALAARSDGTAIPRSDVDHSRSASRPRKGPVPLTLSARPPDRACDENPLAGFALSAGA